jgi:hypothetical protein
MFKRFFRLCQVRRRLLGAPRVHVSLTELKRQMLCAVADCTDTRAERLKYAINNSVNPHELWIMRSSIYLCVAHLHDESVANRRVNELLPYFRGWVPARQLAEI